MVDLTGPGSEGHASARRVLALLAGVLLATFMLACSFSSTAVSAAEPEAQWLKLEAAAELKTEHVIAIQKARKERLEARETDEVSEKTQLQEATTRCKESYEAAIKVWEASKTEQNLYQLHSYSAVNFGCQADVKHAEAEYESTRATLSLDAIEVYEAESAVDELQSNVLRLKHDLKGEPVDCTEGCTSGGSASEVSFATTAQSQLDGDAEALETPLWVLVGAIAAAFIVFLFVGELRSGK